MFLGLECFVAVNRLFDDLLVEIGVDSSAALVLGRVVNAAPVDFLIASLLTHEDVAVVLQLSFSLLTQHVLDLRSCKEEKRNLVNDFDFLSCQYL